MGGKGNNGGEEPGEGTGNSGEIGERPECPEGQRPCRCEDLDRQGKGKGKGNNGGEEGTGNSGENGEGGKGGKGKGKGKGKGSNEIPELCCCPAGGEGPGGEGPGPVPEPRGFCIDEERVGAICIAGSNLEEKAKPAWEVCADQCMGYNKIVNQIQPFYGRSLAPLLEMRKGKGKGKGNGKPSKGGKGKGKGAS